MTKEQRKISARNHYKAAKHFNLQKGQVLHHVDDSLFYTDIERYMEWRIEDLVVMTKSDHISFHMKGKSKPSAFKGKQHTEESKEKNRQAHLKENLSEERLQKLQGINAKKVMCVETGVIYNKMKDAAFFIGLTRTAITQAIKNNGTCGGYHWIYLED